MMWKTVSSFIEKYIALTQEPQQSTKTNVSQHTHTQLLILGYMHEMEKLLPNDSLIPFEIINICVLYYSYRLNIFVPDSFNTQIFMFDIDCKKRTILKPINKSVVILPRKPYCYIQNISSLINTNSISNKSYDCIVSVHGNYNNVPFTTHPILLLFESNKWNYNKEMIKYHTIIPSKGSVIKHVNYLREYYSDPFLCYDNKNGIIYSKNDSLYQIKLNDTNIMSSELLFSEVKQKNYLNDFFAINWKGSQLGYLQGQSIGHLRRENKLFGMTYYQKLFCGTLSNTNIAKVKSTKCGIFDLNRNEWIKISNFEFKQYATNDNNNYIQIGICKNNNYDNELVYIVTNNGYTAKYDMNKNQWIILSKHMKSLQLYGNKQPLVWLNDNPFILYCNYNDQLRYFDTRNYRKKWYLMNDMQFIFDVNALTYDPHFMFL